MPERLRIVLIDENDRAIADQPYVMEIDRDSGGPTFKGRTDGGGAVQEKIRPNARKGRLVVGQGKTEREYYFCLGDVDPLEEISGIQGRLLDLGYYDGSINGRMTARTQSALLLFQDKYHLSPTGKGDVATKAKLKEIFGC